MFIYGKIFKKIPKIAVKSYKILSCVCVDMYMKDEIWGAYNIK